jgi:protein TonB
MKSSILFLLLACSSLSVFSQSKKKINEQLAAQLVAVQCQYDSIIALTAEKASKLRVKQTDFAAAQRRNEQRQETDLKGALKKVEKQYDRLQRLNQDPSKLIRLDSLKENVTSFLERQLSAVLSETVLRPQQFFFTNDSIPVKKQNRKQRHAWLLEQLERYSFVNKENQAKMVQVNAYSEIIDLMRPELDSVYWNYEEVLYDLAIGHCILNDTIQKLMEFSLSNWPKNFSKVYEYEFGMPEGNEWNSKVFYRPDFSNDFIRYANPIPIHEFSVERMKKQRVVIPKFGPERQKIHEYVDEPAEFPGGRRALVAYIVKHLKVPEIAEELGLEFKLRMKFVVHEDGTVSNVSVVKGMKDCPECDLEVIRVLEGMPQWKPALNQGQAVKSYYILPISIHLR